MTMNVREIKHFLQFRMCHRAQWEIRELAETIFGLCYEKSPELFMDAGPGCLLGACPEGEKTCAAEARSACGTEAFLAAHEQANL